MNRLEYERIGRAQRNKDAVSCQGAESWFLYFLYFSSWSLSVINQINNVTVRVEYNAICVNFFAIVEHYSNANYWVCFFLPLRETEEMMLAVTFPSISNYLCRCNGTGYPPFCHSREQGEHPGLPRYMVLTSRAYRSNTKPPEPVEQFLFERKPQQLPCQKQNSCFWQIIFFSIQMDNTK